MIDINEISFIVFKKKNENNEIVLDVKPFYYRGVSSDSYFVDLGKNYTAPWYTCSKSDMLLYALYAFVNPELRHKHYKGLFVKSDFDTREGMEISREMMISFNGKEYPCLLFGNNIANGCRRRRFKNLIEDIEVLFRCKKTTPEFANLCKNLKKVDGLFTQEEVEKISKEFLHCVEIGIELYNTKPTIKQMIEDIKEKSRVKRKEQAKKKQEKAYEERIASERLKAQKSLETLGITNEETMAKH